MEGEGKTSLFPFPEEELNALRRERNIFLFGAVTDELAFSVAMLLRAYERENPSKPIRIIIDSKGGSVKAGWVIVDAMGICKSPIETVCYGEAASIASVIFAKGDRRYMLKHSTLMIHQPWADGPCYPIKESELRNMAEDLTATRREIEEALSECSALSISEIHELTDTDFRISSKKAVSMGFCDAIL